jgi:hypothetical protein
MLHSGSYSGPSTSVYHASLNAKLHPWHTFFAATKERVPVTNRGSRMVQTVVMTSHEAKACLKAGSVFRRSLCKNPLNKQPVSKILQQLHRYMIQRFLGFFFFGGGGLPTDRGACCRELDSS